MLWPPRATPRSGGTHCVGWTSGRAPSRSTAGPLGLRTFLTEEIFSRSNLLIRLKPAGRERRRWDLGGLTLSRQDGEPIPGESGLRGDPVCRASGVFPYPLCSHTCPQPDPRPRAAGTAPLQGKSPCHRSVPKGTGGGGLYEQGRTMQSSLSPSGSRGAAGSSPPAPPGAHPAIPLPGTPRPPAAMVWHRSSKRRSHGSAGSWRRAPQVRKGRALRDAAKFARRNGFPSRCVFCLKTAPRGWNRHQETWTGAADTQGGEMAPRATRRPSRPIPVTSSDLVAPGDGGEGPAGGRREAEPQEMPCRSRARGRRCCLQPH